MMVIWIILSIIGVLLASAFNAFVFETLWNWFMYPVIGSEITFGIAWGLVLMFTFIQSGNAKETFDGNKYGLIKMVVYSFFVSTATLIIGFFINKFLM